MVFFFSWIPCCANGSERSQETVVDPRDKVASSAGFAEPVLQPVHEAVPVLGDIIQEHRQADHGVQPEGMLSKENGALPATMDLHDVAGGLEPLPIPQAAPAPAAKARTAPSQRPDAPSAAAPADKAADPPPAPALSVPAAEAAAPISNGAVAPASNGANAGPAERCRSKDTGEETRSNSRAGSEPERRSTSRAGSEAERRTNSRGPQNGVPKAKSAMKKAAKSQPPTEASMASELTETGDKEFSSGNFDSAFDAYTSAIGLDANNAKAWAGRGGVNIRKGRHSDALDDLNKALALDPKHQYAIRDRGEAKLKLGDFDGAIADYNGKLADAPADGRALCGRGEANFLKGNVAAAVKDFGLAAKLGYPGAAELLKKAQTKQPK